MGIGNRYKQVLSEVQAECVKAGRAGDAATLLAVSKTVGIDGVAQAIEAGACDFGENRPEQIMEKSAAFPNVRWHFIGNIQSRRIKDIVPCAYLIHSLFKESHAKKIDEVAREHGKVQCVLIEVNVSGEESKSGLAPDEVPAMLKNCLALPNLQVCGLMTMAPQGSAEVARQCFSGLAALMDELRPVVSAFGEDALDAFTQLSMGMSEDWPEAIEEGSTIVRIGRAIFSDSF